MAVTGRTTHRAIALALAAGLVAGCGPSHESPDGSVMEYHEAYHGQNFLVTTKQEASGWTYRVDLSAGQTLDSASRHYATSEEAHSAAKSATAEAIDRGRTGTGKP